MFPSRPVDAHPATELWQVERDGNPLRRFGHVSPFIGKLDGLNCKALDQIGQLVRQALPDLPEPTLVIGMTESSLLLAFFMSLWQQIPVDLRFTSRRIRGGEANRIAFREPHSHGPQHYLALAPDEKYAQIVIIEDELTTGATLRNLILALESVSQRVFVATLRDLRPQNLRQELQIEMGDKGITLEVLSLETLGNNLAEEIVPVRPCFNPFGRDEVDREEALAALETHWHEFKPGAVYMVGECVDLALQWWLQLPAEERPEMRQITRSPWKLDGQSVLTAQRFELPDQDSRHFLYNFKKPNNGRVLWIAEQCNASIGAAASAFFESEGLETRGIEVAGT